MHSLPAASSSSSSSSLVLSTQRHSSGFSRLIGNLGSPRDKERGRAELGNWWQRVSYTLNEKVKVRIMSKHEQLCSCRHPTRPVVPEERDKRGRVAKWMPFVARGQTGPTSYSAPPIGSSTILIQFSFSLTPLTRTFYRGSTFSSFIVVDYRRLCHTPRNDTGLFLIHAVRYHLLLTISFKIAQSMRTR